MMIRSRKRRGRRRPMNWTTQRGMRLKWKMIILRRMRRGKRRPMNWTTQRVMREDDDSDSEEEALTQRGMRLK
jgi:hypothetical protein